MLELDRLKRSGSVRPCGIGVGVPGAADDHRILTRRAPRNAAREREAGLSTDHEEFLSADFQHPRSPQIFDF